MAASFNFLHFSWGLVFLKEEPLGWICSFCFQQNKLGAVALVQSCAVAHSGSIGVTTIPDLLGCFRGQGKGSCYRQVWKAEGLLFLTARGRFMEKNPDNVPSFHKLSVLQIHECVERPVCTWWTQPVPDWDLPGFKPFFPGCGAHFQAVFPLLLLLLLSVVEEGSGSHGEMSKPNFLTGID